MNIKLTKLNRLNQALLAVSLICLLLYLGKLFLIPVAIGAFLAMLLFPVMQYLQQVGLKKNLAALLAILLLLGVLSLLSTVVYSQISAIQSDLPELEKKIGEKTKKLQWVLYQKTDLSTFEQKEILNEEKPDIIKAIGKTIKNALVQSLYLVLAVFITLTYTFFFLIYEQKIQHFFVQLHIFENHRHSQVMLAHISRIAHNYLKGTLTVIAVLAVIYALGFCLIGLQHPILFALITALLRIVPYFGTFLGIGFPILFSFLTEDSGWQALFILVFFMVMQLVEANLLTPYITGSRVKLNPLATILVILLGNLLWGVPGMILFVPLFAMVKVVCDHVTSWQPYGFILGKEKEEEVNI